MLCTSCNVVQIIICTEFLYKLSVFYDLLNKFWMMQAYSLLLRIFMSIFHNFMKQSNTEH